MKNVYELDFKKLGGTDGFLTPIEGKKDVPFDVKRIYYIYHVPEMTHRGFHSHRNLQQVLICLAGKVKILTKTPYDEKITELNAANKGLFIGEMVWREMYDFSENAVLMVLASEYYDESDYIRDYNKYHEEASQYWQKYLEDKK